MASETRSPEELVTTVERLGPSDHLCMSYHSGDDMLPTRAGGHHERHPTCPRAPGRREGEHRGG
jgi:hypothetical protein